jgi:hypothetical protein
MTTTGFRDFVDTFRAHWLAAMSGGLSVPFALVTAFVDNAPAKILFGALAFIGTWFAAYKIWSQERERIIKLEEELRPKIKILGIYEQFNSSNAERVFGLEVKNDSGAEIPNCLAKVTNISLFKIDLDGRLLDYSTAYRRDLPLALRTARNIDRDGGGPFHLRPEETKRIPICTRQDGVGKDLQIAFAPAVPEYYRQIAFVSAGDLEIEIYGTPNPPKEKLHLSLENGQQLKVTRVGAACLSEGGST